MIGVNRRRMMGNRATVVNPYISDGLIFWLDGIYKNQSIGVDWEDLIGGVKFYGGVNNSDNFYIGAGFQSPETVLDANENYTVEAVLMFNVNSPNMSILSCGNTTTNKVLIAGFGNNQYGVLQNQAPWICNMSKDVKHTISANLERCVQNYQEITSQSPDKKSFNEPGDGWYLGRRSIANFFNIYCIRIYNRRLTIDEMKANQAVDNTRFNLGLTIPEE